MSNLTGMELLDRPELSAQLAVLPDKPGVYLMKDATGKILYVGKAINLKNRVRSYFQAGRGHSPKTEVLVAKIVSLETIVTASEVEALILECTLIKKHRPRYNISLRDDKSYPYIKVTWGEAFPRIYATRRLEKDGSRYHGPYANAGAMHETLALLRNMFPLRSCRVLDARRPCLEFHIKRCLAPCAGGVDPDAYRDMVRSVELFLEGRTGDLEKDLHRRMLAASERLDFELAARLRDQAAAVRQVSEKQKMVSGTGEVDVLGLARSGSLSCVQVLFVRGGKLVGRDHLLMSGGEEESDAVVLSAFIPQYYADASYIAREILLPTGIEDTALLEEWLTSKKGETVRTAVPQRGIKKELIGMALENATEMLRQRNEHEAAALAKQEEALAGLAEKLSLSAWPRRIECFDISHIQGAETVASMVVFTDGTPDKKEYRRFKLLTVEGAPDDYESMREVLLRRYREAKEQLPSLIVIDGGKGQLSAALDVIRGVGLGDIPVVGLAKEFEHIFREGNSEPLILPQHSAALLLMRHIRDEAHRFAVTYHRKLRAKRNLVSVLDHVPGIGPARRQALWKHFGSIAEIRRAEVSELTAAPGMNRTAAESVHRFFHPQSD